MNIQFRENLAPEGGAIRGDSRVGSVTSFSSNRFTKGYKSEFNRWSIQENRWQESYSDNIGFNYNHGTAAYEVAHLLLNSRRGIIVVGQVRSGSDKNQVDATTISSFISDFAQFSGLPIFAGVQSANLRFLSPAVIPYGGEL